MSLVSRSRVSAGFFGAWRWLAHLLMASLFVPVPELLAFGSTLAAQVAVRIKCYADRRPAVHLDRGCRFSSALELPHPASLKVPVTGSTIALRF